jgi:hypothetical protein
VSRPAEIRSVDTKQEGKTVKERGIYENNVGIRKAENMKQEGDKTKTE